MKSRGGKRCRPLRQRWDRSGWAAPTGAVLAPLVVMAVLIVITENAGLKQREIEAEIATADQVETLEAAPVEEEINPETAEDSAENIVEVAVETEAPPSLESVSPLPSLAPTFEPVKLPTPDTLAAIKSPVVIKTLAGAARGRTGRSAALSRFGGNAATELVVMRALRYLKTLQRPDGSWKAKGEGDATAFALLAFLSHGEDFSSAEFGEVVRRAVRYLSRRHGNAMSVYALAEAAAVVKTPVVKEIAAAAVDEMCARRRKGVKANSGGLLQRYSSVMAVASARLSRIDSPSISEARADFLASFSEMRDAKAPDFTRIRGDGTWRFMIAAVCLQYLGAGEEASTRAMVERLESIWPPATLGKSEIACCPVRSNYFSTMMFFNGGGKPWEQWNAGMQAAYVKSQKVEKGAYVAPDGSACEIGYWLCEDRHIGDQPFWSTCYVVHQMMIYYRYLPTYSSESWSGAAPKSDDSKMAVDIEVELP